MTAADAVRAYKNIPYKHSWFVHTFAGSGPTANLKDSLMLARSKHCMHTMIVSGAIPRQFWS